MKPDVSEDLERVLYDPEMKAALLADVRGEPLDSAELKKAMDLIAQADAVLQEYVEQLEQQAEAFHAE